jgi:hypothetical protein
MDAKQSPVRASRRSWAVRPWTLVVFGLLLVGGALIQACSDNNGSTGPTFECGQQKGGVKVVAECKGSPAPSTGFANTSSEIRVQLGINPNTISPGRRAGVTAFVTNTNGQPLAGRKVQFSTEVGTLDRTVVETNSAGQASTTLSITAVDAANAGGATSSIVTAFVDGAVGTATVNFGAPVVLVLIPEASSQSVGATLVGPPQACPAGSLGGFTVTFTVSGGVPPYRFTTAGTLGNISSNGVYTVPVLGGGPFGTTFKVTDVVTVTDAVGATDTSQVTVECVSAAS